jgi:hypothetical protein
VTAVGKKQDEGEAVSSDDDTIEAYSSTGVQSLREGLLPLDLATVKDFLRFIIATSRGLIDDGDEVTVDSMTTFSERFFTGFARITGNDIEETDRRAVYDVSIRVGR